MAISPQDAGQLSPEELSAAQSLEEEIDDAMRTYYVPQADPIMVHINRHLSTRITDYVLRRYRALGWTVADRNSNERGTKHWLYFESTYQIDPKDGA